MPERGSGAYMRDRVSVVGVAAGALLIVGAIAVAIAVSFFMLHVGHDGVALHDAVHAGEPPRVAGGVALQPSPVADIEAFRREKERTLSSYGWVDRDHGIARIPIARAMALLAREGSDAAPRPR